MEHLKLAKIITKLNDEKINGFIEAWSFQNVIKTGKPKGRYTLGFVIASLRSKSYQNRNKSQAWAELYCALMIELPPKDPISWQEDMKHLDMTA